MANHRTIRELKPYKGAEMERVHKDGRYYYIAYMGDGAIICEHTLKELKKAVREYDEAELC